MYGPETTVPSGVQTINLNPDYDTSKIDHYEIRMDDRKDGWTNVCTDLIDLDACDNNVKEPFFTYNFQPGHYYHFWYHMISKCGQASSACHRGITVGQ